MNLHLLPALPARFGSVRRAISAAAVLVLLAGLSTMFGISSAHAASDTTGDRVAVLDSHGHCWVKDGDLSSGWVDEFGPNCSFVTVSGTRIGVIDTAHNCWAKDGGLSSGWVELGGNCATLVLGGTTIGMQGLDGYCYAQQGALTTNWLREYGPNCAAVSVSQNRVGVVDSGTGVCSVKEGGLSTGWLAEYGNNCNGITVSDNRIGVRTTGRTCLAKEGGLSTGWVSEMSPCDWMQVTNTRLMALQNNTCYVKDGGLSAGWLAERGPSCPQGGIDGDRIGTRDGNGHCYVKAGDPSGSWLDEFGPGCQWIAVTSNVTWYPPSLVTAAMLQKVFGYSSATISAGLPSLNAEMARAGITTAPRVAALLATLKAESGFRYDALESCSGKSYSPFCGRGFIQLTLRANYAAASSYFGHDFVNNMEDARSLTYSAPIVRWYWTVTHTTLNRSADSLNVAAVTRAVNGSGALLSTLNARCTDFKKVLNYYGYSYDPNKVVCS